MKALFGLVCEYASSDERGKTNLLGIFEQMHIPQRDDKYFFVKFFIAIKCTDIPENYKFNIELESKQNFSEEGGKKVLFAEAATLNNQPKDMGILIIPVELFEFPFNGEWNVYLCEPNGSRQLVTGFMVNHV